MKIKNLYLPMFCTLVLSSCMTGGGQKNNSNTFKPINTGSVTYIIPSDTEVTNNTINGLNLDSYRNRYKNKNEVLNLNKKQNHIEVERRTETISSVAGSGVVYRVSLNTIEKDGYKQIKLTPTETRSYQEGIILPFPVPPFNIINYLSTSKFTHDFEINSEYSAESVKANFNRMLKRKQPTQHDMKQQMLARLSGKQQAQEDVYILNINNNKVWLKVETYPYRKGSKAVITTTINTIPNNDGIININEQLKAIKENITKIVNS